MRSPYEGIKVIDLSEEIAGPLCSAQLSDAGAEVIKVEPPGGDCSRQVGPFIGGESALFTLLNRGKKSVVIDVRKRQGKDILFRLAEHADVFLESFRPGVTKELGLDYQTLAQINPKIIYCSITPLGEDGPYKDWPASELEVQGMSGFLQWIGNADVGAAPVRMGADLASTSAGIVACTAIAAALFYRQKTGLGQKVGTSLLRALMGHAAWLTAASDPDEWRGVWAEGPYLPPQTGYRTKDVPISFGFLTPDSEEDRDAFAELCKDLGLEDLLKDPWIARYGTRMVGIGMDAEEMKPVFEEAFSTRSSQELVTLINSKTRGIAAPFNDYEALLHHPQVEAIEILQEVEHPVQGKIKVIGPAWRFSNMSVGVQCPSPVLGQHTKEVLCELGYGKTEIMELEVQEIIFCGRVRH